MIDAQDNPVKQGAVQRFGHGVSGCDSLTEDRRDHAHDDIVINEHVKERIKNAV